MPEILLHIFQGNTADPYRFDTNDGKFWAPTELL